MIVIEIGIKTGELELAHLLESEQISLEGITVLSQKHIQRRVDVDPHLVEIVVQVSGAVATGLLANWLYDKLKKKKVRIEINRKEISFNDKGELQRILDEIIKVND